MDWLMEKRARNRNYFQRKLSSQSCPGRPGVVTVPSTDFKSPRGISIALPALVDVGFYFLVPISHAATPTGRGAYCFFLNVGD